MRVWPVVGLLSFYASCRLSPKDNDDRDAAETIGEETETSRDDRMLRNDSKDESHR